MIYGIPGPESVTGITPKANVYTGGMGNGPNPKTWHLRQFSIFDHFDHQALESVTRILRVKEFDRRSPIFLPSSEPRNVYFLIRGRVKITRTDPATGREFSLYIIHPGELFGILARAENGNGNTSAVTLQRSLVAYIPGRAFDQLLQNQRFAAEVNHLVGERLVRVASRLDDLVFRDVHSRLSRLLLRLADEFPAEHGNRRAIDVKLTQSDLAQLIGTTRESVNIVLNEFKRDGLVGVQRRQIVILDRDRLAEIAH
jgi:CRP/FNR family cyclic AMP-dependent transcriptional regulator